MKKIIALLLCFVILAGCTVQTDEGSRPNVVLGIVFMLAGGGGFALALYFRTLDKDKEGTGWYAARKLQDIRMMMGSAILFIIGLVLVKDWIKWFFAR